MSNPEHFLPQPSTSGAPEASSYAESIPEAGPLPSHEGAQNEIRYDSELAVAATFDTIAHDVAALYEDLQSRDPAAAARVASLHLLVGTLGASLRDFGVHVVTPPKLPEAEPGTQRPKSGLNLS